MPKKPAKNELPKISIVIPSFNKGSYIDQTLHSIFSQKYPNLEVIIQDGGSTDETLVVIKKFAKKYPTIINWISKKDKGQLDAINRGLRKATGQILTFINADDVYMPGALMGVGKQFLEYPESLWMTGYGNVIDPAGNVVAPLVTKYKNLLIDRNNYQLLLTVNYITQTATFISKKAYLKYGPFMGNKRYVMEYDLWLKLGKVQMPRVLKRNLASFRLAPEAISLSTFQEILKIDQKIAQKYTKNELILFLHTLNNLGRWGIGTFLTK